MAKIGGHEIVRELHRGPFGSVFVVGAAGVQVGDGAQKTVKVCRPPADVIGEEAASRVVEGFVESMELQRTLADSSADGTGRWLRVLEVRKPDGRQGEDAFAAVELAARGPVSKLVFGAARIDEAGLYNIARATVAGLLALRERFGRAHGALHSGNILLLDDLPPSQARVVVADPAPASRLGADAFTGDVRMLGRVLYALVMRREHGGGWPLSSSPVWNEIEIGGSGRGAAWRELVNRLLDPGLRVGTPEEQAAGAASLTLEQVAESIEALRPRAAVGGRRRYGVIGAAVAVIAAVVGGYALLDRSGREGSDPGGLSEQRWGIEPRAHERWRQVCDEYFNWLWSLTKLDRRVEGNVGPKFAGETRRELLEAGAPELLAVIAGFGEGADHPGAIAGLKDAEPDFRALREAPTASARSDSGVARTERLIGSIAALKAMIAGRSGGDGDAWPGAARLRAAAEEFASRGWQAAAGRARDLAAALGSTIEAGRGIRPAIDEAVAAQVRLRSIEGSRKTISAAAAELARTGDPIAARFAAAADRLMSPGGGGEQDALAGLAERAEQVAGLAARLSEFARGTWKTIDTEELFRSEEYRRLAARAEPDAASFEAWVALASRFPSLPAGENPAPRAIALLGDLNSAVESYEREVAPSRPMPRALQDGVSRARTQAAQLGELAWVKSNRERIERASAELQRDLPRLTAGVTGAVADHRASAARSREEIIAQLREKQRVSAHSPLLDAEWRTRRDALLAGAGDAPKETIAASAKDIETALLALDAAMEAPPNRESGVAKWRAALADAFIAEREARIGRAVAELRGKELAPEAVQTGIGPEARGFAEWAAKASEVRERLDRIGQALTTGHGLAGRVTVASGTQSVEDAWASISADSISRDERLAPVVAAFGERIEVLRRIGRETDPERLVEIIKACTAGEPETALAAWSRLGEGGVAWPSSPADFAGAGEIRGALSGCILGAPIEQASRSELSARVASEFVARWRSAAMRALDPSTGDKAQREAVMVQSLDAAAGFGVSDAALAESDGRLRYARAMHRLRSGLKAAPGDAAVAAAAATFTATVEGLPADVRSRPAVDELLGAMRTFARPPVQEPNPVVIGTLGPGRRQFAVRAEAGDRVVEFTIGGAPVRFRRVEFTRAGAGSDVVYLSESEVSLDLFQKLLSLARIDRGRFFDMVPEMDRDGGWAGPRVWDWPEGSDLQPSRYWVESQSVYQSTAHAFAPLLAADARATAGRGLRDGAGGNPQRKLAVQRISARVAVEAAAAAGCRLPTVEEWKAALAQSGAAVSPQANLRDQTFQQQYSYIDELRRGAGANYLDFYPYPDEFSYQKSRPGSAAGHAFNDEVLWFRDADSGAQAFRNLVGNVAEFVYTQTGPIADEPSRDLAVAAIGASALSDAAIPVDQPRPIESTASAFADVGFRLAFSATGSKPAAKPLAQQVAERLGGQSLLLD
ncbi:MAG: hypothetical protein IT438_06955 [Phycisphaerales bacterium]|nr:hypothetical protein [Phycisphaerales bacterium]